MGGAKFLANAVEKRALAMGHVSRRARRPSCKIDAAENEREPVCQENRPVYRKIVPDRVKRILQDQQCLRMRVQFQLCTKGFDPIRQNYSIVSCTYMPIPSHFIILNIYCPNQPENALTGIDGCQFKFALFKRRAGFPWVWQLRNLPAPVVTPRFGQVISVDQTVRADRRFAAPRFLNALEGAGLGTLENAHDMAQKDRA